MKTSSCGLEAFTRSTDATSTFWRFSLMLPLLSMMMPNEIGTSSCRKNLMGCSIPFSKTLKAFCCRSVISFPFLSETLTGRITQRVSARKRGGLIGRRHRTAWAERMLDLTEAAAERSRATGTAHSIQGGRRPLAAEGRVVCTSFTFTCRYLPSLASSSGCNKACTGCAILSQF